MMSRRSGAALVAALLLSACAGGVIPPSAERPVPSDGVATRPVPATPRPTLPVIMPTEPGLDNSTAAGLGVARGPDIAALIPSGERSRLALKAFRLSCPSLMNRPDQSGLTSGADWNNACAAASSWPEASASEFFSRYFEAVQVGDGNAFVTGYYEPEIAGSRTQQTGYAVPIYRRPTDLIDVNLGQFSDSLKGRTVRGKVQGTNLVPYDERAQIVSGSLAGRGLELAWAADPVEFFFLQIQGSGRLLLPDGELAFDDLILGPRRFRAEELGDPVVRREDGSVTYLFASAVDDADLEVSHVIRGEDHVTNTALQLAILAALGQPAPCFAHLPLIADAAGRQFSKRLGALSLRSLREQGIEPLAIVATLAALGTSHAAEPDTSLERLVAGFALEAYGRAAPKLLVDDLPRFSAALLHHLPHAAVAARLREIGLGGIDAGFWQAICGNLERLEDARLWFELCSRPLRPEITDRELLAAAAELLPEDLAAGFAGWIEALKAATGRKGKALFQPLRLALTGREHGPELKHLLPLLGRERAEARLRGRTA